MYDFDWSSIVPSMPYLLAGLVITLKITVIAIVVGIVWGTLLAVMRLSSFLPLAWFAKTYVNVFRSIPLVMVLLWFYLIVPGFLQNVLGLSPRSGEYPFSATVPARSAGSPGQSGRTTAGPSPVGLSGIR